MKTLTMRRLIYSLFAIVFSVLFIGCQSTAPTDQPTGWISGKVVGVSGAPLHATISIGDESVETDAHGKFSISPKFAHVYRIEVRAENHFEMRHTFSHAELVQAPSLDSLVLVERKAGRTMFVFGGDAMIGRRYYRPFHDEQTLIRDGSVLADSKALLREMKPYLERADYASINLESPIFKSPPGPAAAKSVTFYSAPETLEALKWAGVDYVALGNNHVYDFLEPGLERTLDFLALSSLDYSGAGENEREALRPHRHVSENFDYDFLSYVGWAAGPPTQSAEVGKGGAALGTAENLVATTKSSVAEGGIPILQFHGGLEYVEEPTLSVETKLKQAVDAGAGLIIGHHPHVVQGLELYKGKLIAWSLGNFLFDQYFYSAQSAALLYVWMDGDEFYHAEAVPIYLKGYHPTPAVGEMRNSINRRLIELSGRRETQLQKSGGHMVLSTYRNSALKPLSFRTEEDCFVGRMREGYDLLSRGDFDSYFLFGANDRSWIEINGKAQINSKEHTPWDSALFLNIGRRETVTTGMRKFKRVFSRGAPMSVRANITSTQDAIVNVLVQTRATNQSLEDALIVGKKELIGTAKIEAGRATKLDIDFDSPRTRARSIRILLEFKGSNGDAVVELDDLKLIEWKTPFRESEIACR